jgi:hypothetical protein
MHAPSRFSVSSGFLAVNDSLILDLSGFCVSGGGCERVLVWDMGHFNNQIPNQWKTYPAITLLSPHTTTTHLNPRHHYSCLMFLGSCIFPDYRSFRFLGHHARLRYLNRPDLMSPVFLLSQSWSLHLAFNSLSNTYTCTIIFRICGFTASERHCIRYSVLASSRFWDGVLIADWIEMAQTGYMG